MHAIIPLIQYYLKVHINVQLSGFHPISWCFQVQT